MPLYSIKGPDGNTYQIEGPEGATREQIIDAVQFKLSNQPPAPEEGVLSSLIGGFKQSGAGLETALGSIFAPEVAARRGLQRQEELAAQYAPGADLEKLKRTYEKEGLLSAAGEAVKQIPSALAEQAPNILATLAGGAVGSLAGPAGTIAGATLPSLIQQYSSGLVRQEKETPGDISRLSALGAAVPGAALDAASTLIPLGRTFMGKILGPEVEKMLARGVTSAAIEKQAKESILGSITRGGGIGLLAEVPTEVAQQMLERLQAGLPLTSDDALAEYGETAYGSALVGLPFGVAGRTYERPAVRQQYAALKQKEDLAAFEKEKAEKLAARQAIIDKTKANLGINEAPLLALPAPAQVAEPEEIDLQNPVGNIARNELAPEVLKYVDKYRKDMGMPKLQSFSIEDIRDAMTQVHPEGEQAALDSILAFKTGYKGEESFTPEDVINAAGTKNIAPDTKGFADFLERATGSRDLQSMTQPQLYAAFKSLSRLQDVAPGQEIVLPEGSNANRFTQKQYDAAVGQVKASLESFNNRPLSRDVISEEVMKAAKLESQRAADMLLDTAIKNGDLVENRQQVFRTVNRKTGEVEFTYQTRQAAEAAAKGRRLDVQEQTLVTIGPKEAERPSTRPTLPAGYEIAEQDFAIGERPAGYSITPEGRMKPLATILDEQDIPGKIERLQGLRRAEADKMLQEVGRHEQTVKRGRAALEAMEARGESDTDAYRKAKGYQESAERILSKRITRLLDRIEEYSAPLQAKPFGKKQATRKGFTIFKDGKNLGTFPTRGEAIENILTKLSDQELQDIIDAAPYIPAETGEAAALPTRAQKELESRKKPGIKVKKSVKSEEQIKAEKERDEKVKKLEELLVPMLSKFGLKDVALKIVDQIENGAGGSYLDKLIKISLDEDKPVQTLRHEAIHALKELGFFTPQQWKALEREAKKTWIDKYLKGQMTELNGKVMSRFDAYKELGLSESEILEEAIADAFGDFDVNKAPPGMLTALLKRIKEFFASLNRALTGAGFESAEEIFGKIEAGKLDKQVEAMDKVTEKFSLGDVNLEVPKGIPADVWRQFLRHQEIDQKYDRAAAPQVKAGITRSWRALNNLITKSVGEKASLEMHQRLNAIFGIRQAIAEGDDRGLEIYKVTNPEIYSQETGEKFSLGKPSEANAWQADEATIKAADKFEEDNGIRPYVSEGFLDLPIQAPKYSLQKYNPEKHLKFDPTLGVPINKDGTVTVYYHTTKQGSLNISQSKVIPSEGRNRVYLTNESGGDAILRDRGNFDQELDGSTVLVYVTPDMLQVDNEYDNGRRDFFIPLAQGDFFNKKMKMQSIQKGRQEAITGEFSYDSHEASIAKAVKAYKDADPKERKAMVAAARKLLKKEHNVGSLLSENGKLEKTRIGEYGLDYEGNSVASQGLGLASAQKITEKVSTCPRSAICEGLCLGETSGGNFMFGGIASEDVEDIAKSAFRAGPRMMQYLKTEALIINPEAFATVLQAEIDSLKKWSASPTQTKMNKETGKREQVQKEIYQPAVRLNVTSDFKPEMFRAVIDGNPDVQFYDYTKLGSDSIAPNHHLTYSSTGFGQIVDGEKVFFKTKAGQYDHNWATMRDRRLNNGQNVAMAFSSKSALPKFLMDEETGVQYRVWDGDDYDARFLDPKQANGLGMIIGLRNKAGNLSEKNATKKTGGFFVQYDPKKDGDTVVVPNQAQFKEPGRKVIPVAKAEKLSLRRTDTKQFKDWFGDSKVVDKDGNPLVVYHGTRSDFEEFDKTKQDVRDAGFYFASPIEANNYASNIGGNVIPAYLKIENPKIYYNRDVKLTPEHIEELKAKGYDGVIRDFAKGPDAWRYGVDASPEYVVFEPTQIKSSIGNIGTYDASNPNIRYSLRRLDSEEFKNWFGKSKIVDKDGKPLVMYHGLAKDTTDFTRKTKRGAPIFLTDDPEFAQIFAADSYESVARNPEEYLSKEQIGAGVKRAIAAIKKDYGKDSLGKEMVESLQTGNLKDATPEAREYIQKEFINLLPTGPHIMPLYVRAENPFDYDNPSHVTKVVFELNKTTDSDGRMLGIKMSKDIENGNWGVIEDGYVQDAIKALGFDSFYVEEQGRKNLAVYQPNQVKSATGNVGTYSRDSNDVRYSLRNVAFPTVKEAKEAAEAVEVPDTMEFKRYIAGNQWVDEDGKAKKFYHATTSNFFEFNEGVIYLSDTAEEAEKWGRMAEDRLREQIYRALNKDEKLPFFQKAVDEAVSNDKITQAQGEKFMRDASRKIPEFGDYDLIKKEMDEALLSLAPDRMKIMPLYARAVTPFDFRNKDHVQQVMSAYNYTQEMDRKIGEVAKQVNKEIGGAPTVNVENILDGLKGILAQGYPKVVERPDIIRTIRKLGFDGYITRRNRNAPLSYAVFKPEQVKSITGNIGEFGESKDVRYSLKNAVGSFDPNAIEKESETQYKGYSKLINMKISDFLALADDERDPVKQQRADRLVKEDTKLSSIPFLKAYGDGDTLVVEGHEGRHRARALQKAGYETMPVVLTTDIRYSEQLDPQKFDYRKTWPSKIQAQSKAKDPNFTIPFPFTREEGAQNYQPKFSLPRVDPKIDARVDTITTAREQKGFFERITDAISPSTFSSLRQAYLNRYEQLGRYDKLLVEKMGGAALLADQSAESAALMSDYASGVAASAMGYGDRHGGIPVYRNGTTVIDRSVKGLIASLTPLAKYGDPKVYQYYQFWAGAKRAKRLKAEGRERVYTQDDFDYADILEKDFPEFVDVQKDLVAFNNGIVKFMVDTQVLSPEMGSKYTEHADYIPFYRQMDGEKTAGPNIFSAISGVRPPKKLKGGDAPLADFLETLVRNTQSSIEAGMKNAAANRAIKVVQAVGNVPGVALERLNTQESGPNIINVLENGKRISYKTTDKLLVEAVGSLNMTELPFMGLISGPSNLLRNLVTKDPGFMLANLVRDSLSAYVTSGQDMMPIAGTMGNFAKALAKKSPGYEALLDAGIIGGYELSQNVEQSGASLARDLDKKAGKKDPIYMRPFTSLWQALETGTTASDAATRALVYERVLKETGNEAEALHRAVEVMNFNRKGNSPLIRVLTAAVPFFNARLQGLDLFYRASTGNMNTNDAKAIQRKFWTRGATMMALSVMYYMMVADDDEYKKQEQETKDGNWIIPSLGIRIPIPFEVGVLFKTMPERITAYLLGNDTGKDLRESTVRNILNTFAFNPIPQTVKPIVEAATNFSFFTMRPIVGQGMADVAPEFQVGPGTSKVAEMLGKQLGISPLKIDHVLKGYTGTMGMYMVDTTDLIMEQFGQGTKANKRFEQLPVVKRFALDPEARGSITAYYELKDSVDTFTRTSNLLEKTSKPEEFAQYVKKNAGMLAVKDYVLDLEKEMKEMREMRRTITSSSMDGEQKKNMLVTIGRAEQNLTANIQTVKKAIASLQ